MNMGLECRYFNFRTPSFDPWPEAEDYYDNENVVFYETKALSTDLTRGARKLR